MLKKTRVSWVVLAGIVMAVLFLGMTAGVVGAASNLRLEYSPAATKSFAGYEAPEGYAYYYLGRANMPEAVLGIREDYELRSDLWRRAEMGPTEVRTIVSYFNRDLCLTSPMAYTILDPEGEIFGVWYSDLQQANVTADADRQVRVTVPGRHRRGLVGESE